MNRHYRQFGQGLTMRGNDRSSIPTTGGAWGANYNYSDMSQRHFLMAKDMHKPTINTAYGLSTEQKAYKNIINPTTRAGFNAGLTGTGGLFGTVTPSVRMAPPTRFQPGRKYTSQTEIPTWKPSTEIPSWKPSTEIPKYQLPTPVVSTSTGGLFGSTSPAFNFVPRPQQPRPTTPTLPDYKFPTISGPTGGAYRKKKSKKSRKRKSSRRTGGYYSEIRKAINEVSTSGMYKKRRKSSRRTKKSRR